MTHFVADDESSGLLRAAWLAGLAALLVALWGRQAGAVTLMEADVARLGGLCASAVQGLPTEPGLGAAVALPDDVAGSESAAPEWAAGELSAGSIVRLTLSGMSAGVPTPPLEMAAPGARLGDGPMGLGWTPVASPDASEGMDPLERSLGAGRVAAGGVAAAAHEAGGAEQGMGPGHARWLALLLAPGLLAMIVALSGIVLNLPDPED